MRFNFDDTVDDTAAKSVSLNLRLIGTVCNLVIFIVLGIVLANLVTALNGFKSNKEKMRKPLFKTAAAFITCFIFLVIW